AGAAYNVLMTTAGGSNATLLGMGTGSGMTAGSDGSTTSGTNFQVDNTSTTTVATNLKNAINNNTGTTGVTATSSSSVVTITASGAGASGNNALVKRIS